jgi:TP901 family phage tail tape measure protein
MARVGALSRATVTELNLMTDAAIEAGLATQFSPTEAAEGLAELAVRGFQASEAVEALTGTLDFAQGGQISVAQASATVGAALRAFSLSADQASITTDKLLRISNVTALQANELELALGTVARGAGLARQSIEEILPAMGLVRNTGVQASVAASSVSSALIFMAKNSERFDQVLGRTNSLVHEGTGEFRDFMDVILETSGALNEKYTTQTERARAATELFGRFGVSAYAAISRQLEEGIRNSEGQIVRGAEAIEFLRKSMHGAGGAAEEFRRRLQETFEGQVTLLQGTVQTLATVIGGPFGKAFMPILKIVRYILNAVINFFRVIPEGARIAVAGLIMLSGVLFTAAGAVTLLGLGFAILLPFLKIALVTIAVTTVALGGFAIAIGGVVVAVGALYVAVRRNIGGLGTFVTRTVQQIKLVFTTLVDLFTHGGVREGSKILAPQNAGLLQFALNVYAVGSRIIRFMRGIGAGFTEGLDEVRPVITSLVDALLDLGEALGFMSSESARATVTGESTQTFFEKGAEIGRVFARVVSTVAQGVRGLAKFLTGLVTGFDAFLAAAQPGIDFMIDSFSEMFTQVNRALQPLFDVLGVTTDAGDGMQSFGEKVAWAAGGLVTLLAGGLGLVVKNFMMIVHAVRAVILVFRVLWGIMSAVGQGTIDLFMIVVETITAAIDGLIAQLARAASAIPPQFRPTFLNDLIVAGAGAEERRQAHVESIRARGAQALGRFTEGGVPLEDFQQLGADAANTFLSGWTETRVGEQATTPAPTESPRPAVAQMESRAGETETIGGRSAKDRDLDAALFQQSIMTSNRELAAAIQQRPIVVQVQLDGEMISETRRSSDESAGRQVGSE